MKLEMIRQLLLLNSLNFTRPVIVAVSGGPDSLCLLHVLNGLGYPLVVAHFNHGLREEAGQDEAHVQAFANRLGLPYYAGRQDVGAYARAEALSLEEAARLARYHFLFGLAQELEAQAVAVGHTADDQVETVLLHLLRGSGLAGLTGMVPCLLPNPWSAAIPLLRPLLNVWRAQVLEYCREYDLQPVYDRTNQDPVYFRNRIRLALLPEMDSCAPGFKQRLHQAARILQADEQALETAVEALWPRCVRQEGAGWLAFDVEALKGQPLGLQRRLARRALERFRPGLLDIGFEVSERLLNFMNNPTATRQRDLAAGLRLVLEGDLLWLATWEADLPSGGWPALPGEAQQELPLAIPGVCRLADGWRLEIESCPDVSQARQLAQHNPDPYQAWLDAEALAGPLVVRVRRPGDRFEPLGMEGRSLKLSDLMINIKLPRRARGRWPLLCSRDQIAWLPGIALSQRARLGEHSRGACYARLVRE